MDQTVKEKVVSGFMWKFVERFSSQGVSFLVSIILARILTPSEYGTVAMIAIFCNIANVFVVSGLSSALIQKKDADDLDFSTILYCSLTMSLFIYIIMYLSAPLISDFYNTPELTSLTRVYSLTLFISAYNSVQQAWVSRHMLFRKFFYSTISGNVFSGLIGVIMAYSGYGVWALIAQVIISQLVNTLVLRHVISWRSNWMFSRDRAKPLIKYGMNILGADLIGKFFQEIRQLAIGRFFLPSDLAFYNRGSQFPHLISSNVDSSINQVLFPALSNFSDEPAKMKNMMRRSIRVSSYISFFFMTLLFIIAKPLVMILLTEKWTPSVPYMQLFCIGNMIITMSTVNLQALKAAGRSDLILKLEIYKKPVLILMVMCAIPYGAIGLGITVPLYSIYSAFINMRPNKKVLNYGIKEQLGDYLPTIIRVAIMAIIVYPLNCLFSDNWTCVLVDIIMCFFLYISMSILMKVESFYYIKSLIVGVLKRKEKI